MTDECSFFEDDSVNRAMELQELRLQEPNIYGRKRYVERTVQRFIGGGSSLTWLHRSLGLPSNFDLASMILIMELDGSASFYRQPIVIKKPEGGNRIIISPGPELMFVQQRINGLLQHTFLRPHNVFGYRGGNCLQVAQRHVNWPSTLKFDIRNAFFQVNWSRLRNAMRGHFGVSRGFSARVAHWIAKLCTYSPAPKIVSENFPGFRSFLPQGAPTSPVCFDLACGRIDKKLGQIAQRVGGIVSRYADNYYFSMPTSQISSKLERIIMCDVQKRGFPVHKVRRVGQGELCRILGYNLVDGKISNTRDFQRLLRGALYVLKSRLDRGLEWQHAYLRVKGFMGFAINVPCQLQQVYDYCKSKIENL